MKCYCSKIVETDLFKDNSEHINLAILGMTVLDLVMAKNEHKEDIFPLSASLEFVLKKEHVAVLSQLLLLRNLKLSKLILDFI